MKKKTTKTATPETVVKNYYLDPPAFQAIINLVADMLREGTVLGNTDFTNQIIKVGHIATAEASYLLRQNDFPAILKAVKAARAKVEREKKREAERLDPDNFERLVKALTRTALGLPEEEAEAVKQAGEIAKSIGITAVYRVLKTAIKLAKDKARHNAKWQAAITAVQDGRDLQANPVVTIGAEEVPISPKMAEAAMLEVKNRAERAARAVQRDQDKNRLVQKMAQYTSGVAGAGNHAGKGLARFSNKKQKRAHG